MVEELVVVAVVGVKVDVVGATEHSSIVGAGGPTVIEQSWV